MNRKIALGAAVAAFALLTVSAWLVYAQFSSLHEQIADLQTRNSALESQNSDLQNQTIQLRNETRQLHERIGELLEQLGENSSSPVRIVDFEWDGGFYPIVGVTLIHPVKVTIRNDGDVAAGGLSIGVRLIDMNIGYQIGTSGGTDRIDPLQPKETRTVGVGAYTTVGTSLQNAALVITLKQGSTVLDEWTRNIDFLYD